MSDEGIFDLDEEIEEIELVDTTRSRQPYKETTVRAATKVEALANAEGMFADDEFWKKDPLRDLYVNQQDILDVRGKRGLTTVSLFTGCGGSLTGFNWSGWEDILAVEFVKAARESLAANYPSYLVEPEQVLEAAILTAEEMDLPVLEQGRGHGSPEEATVCVTKKRKVRKGDIQPMVNWESTFSSLAVKDRDLPNQFRTKVNEKVFTQISESPNDGMPIWGDDVRSMDPYVAMKFMGLERGDLDCLEGSPPCKSFSVSGIREKGWGNVLHYSDERDQRTDDLFMEFLRFLDAFLPKSFVAENVAGIGMGSAETDVMAPLMEAFGDLGYHVEARVLNSLHHGVPQSRPRMIFVGIRKDLRDSETGQLVPINWPASMESVYTCQDALNLVDELELNTPEGIAAVDISNFECGKAWRKLGLGASPENKMYQMIRCHPDRPVPTITATSAGTIASAGPTHPHECRKFTIPEYRALFSFPMDYQFTGDIQQQGERMGRSVPPHMMKCIADSLAETLQSATIGEWVE